jgi:4-methyl-5(b-hydroxyethyl)-thiazole monophosphate biosynthesis
MDRNVITSKGPGTAMEFALKLVEVLKDARTARELAKALLVG